MNWLWPQRLRTDVSALQHSMCMKVSLSPSQIVSIVVQGLVESRRTRLTPPTNRQWFGHFLAWERAVCAQYKLHTEAGLGRQACLGIWLAGHACALVNGCSFLYCQDKQMIAAFVGFVSHAFLLKL